MNEQQLLRRRAIVLARESGMTFEWIAQRHGISRQRAHQIYTEATWPTDVAREKRVTDNIMSMVDRVIPVRIGGAAPASVGPVGKAGESAATDSGQ